jgi:hypothetical protein
MVASSPRIVVALAFTARSCAELDRQAIHRRRHAMLVPYMQPSSNDNRDTLKVVY